jgi:glucose-6-phosphate isomerase
MSSEPRLPFRARIGRASDLAAIESTFDRARSGEWAVRLAARDATLWSNDAGVQEKIANRLGWLDAPEYFTTEIPSLEAFGESPVTGAATRVTDFVVAGMGGSSLAPEVLARAFSDITDWGKARICDSTDPEAVRSAVAGLSPESSYYLLASKSGTTTETLSFAAYAYELNQQQLTAKGLTQDPTANFAAISDPSPCVDGVTKVVNTSRLFLNPADIGGRYSALSFVGLVPAALLGIDLDPLLASGSAAVAQSRDPEPAGNHALALGCIMGALAREGRDKMTLIVDEPIDGFGAWAEQLVAESTGKHGVGVVPVDGEPLGAVTTYGEDRLFVRIKLDGGTAPRCADGSDVDARLDALAAAGHPVLEWTLNDRIDIGGEFVRWEAATAFAGAVLNINPFDEPNVTESKTNTANVLAELAANGALPELPAKCSIDGLQLWVDDALPAAFADDAERLIAGQLDRLGARGYIGIQAYIASTPARTAALTRLRLALRDATGRATTVGIGPRFLHSTGQLHKGGAPIGWFLQIVAGHPRDLAIPGRPYSFGQLIDAQALGDVRSLADHGLPVLRVHLGDDPDAGLTRLTALIERVLAVR